MAARPIYYRTVNETKQVASVPIRLVPFTRCQLDVVDEMVVFCPMKCRKLSTIEMKDFRFYLHIY